MIENAISPQSKAILAMHYAGVGCEMDHIKAISGRHRLTIIEDAAQGIMARYRNQPLGSIGDFGALSFHETKNIISGEGGCILVNQSEKFAHAEIIREKGTDRSRFFRGEIDKYTWQDIGSSYLPGELVAAFLAAQLEQAEDITRRRLQSWNYYHQLLAGLETSGHLRRPVIPTGCEHNGHIYHVLLDPAHDRNHVLAALREHNIRAVFHYVPLHSSPAGLRYGRISGDMRITDDLSSRLVRLPLWSGISEADQHRVVAVLEDILNR